MEKIIRFDERAFKWIASLHCTQPGTRLPKLFKWISKSADGHLYPVLLLAMYIFDNTYGYLLLYTAVMAYAFELPIYLFLKQWFKRPRPKDLIRNLDTFVVPLDKFSLPSGHTTAAFLMASLISFFYPSFSIAAFTWASMVGMSRVVLRVHYPMDVVLGACLGVSVSLFSIQVLH